MRLYMICRPVFSVRLLIGPHLEPMGAWYENPQDICIWIIFSE